MNAFARALVAVVALAGSGAAAQDTAATSLAADLAGAWSGTATHEGESTLFALDLVPAAGGQLTLVATIPAMHLERQEMATVTPKLEGDTVRLGPFAFVHDAAGRTLTGVVPEVLAPVYRIPLVLRRVPGIAAPDRREPGGTPAQPVWTYEAGSPLWAGPTFAGGVVLVGGTDGQVHAVEAGTGRKRWSFRAGGAVRTRPTVSDGAVYVQADDGFLYKLAVASGEERWRVRVVESPIERLPFDNPKSRYDRFGSDVTVAEGRLYLGTHDGKVLALDPENGARVWSFATGDAVLAAPAVDSGRVYAGSFDKHVYALDAAGGRLLWKRDTQGAVVSTPASAGDRIVVGNRAYDVLGLDAKTGDVAWKRYVWFSWIESSPVVRDGVAYVGSSDAAAVFAFDVASGRRLWAADVHGWAWGQPAVTEGRVYAGTSSQVGYPAGHRAGLLALDRASGRAVWRYEVPAGQSGAFGFPGSTAVGDGLVFASGLDGKLYAFPQ